jgi:hypothetical protein
VEFLMIFVLFMIFGGTFETIFGGTFETILVLQLNNI